MTDDKITDDKTDYKFIAFGGVMMFVLLSGFGIGLIAFTESTIDYENLHNVIVTNSTFVDHLDCPTIKRDLRALELSPNILKQDQVDILIQDFEKISTEKKCNV